MTEHGQQYERQVDPDKAAETRGRLAEERIVLEAAEVAALASAYRLLDSIYQRHHAKLDRASESEADDGNG